MSSIMLRRVRPLLLYFLKYIFTHLLLLPILPNLFSSKSSIKNYPPKYLISTHSNHPSNYEYKFYNSPHHPQHELTLPVH